MDLRVLQDTFTILVYGISGDLFPVSWIHYNEPLVRANLAAEENNEHTDHISSLYVQLAPIALQIFTVIFVSVTANKGP